MKHKAAPKTARAKAPCRQARPAPMSEAHRFAIEAARSLHDDKCTEIAVLDVRGRTDDRFPHRRIRHVRPPDAAVMHHVQELGEKLGYTAVRSTSDDRGDLVAGRFHERHRPPVRPNTRAHYDIEMMWGDAPIAWECGARSPRDQAGLNTADGD